MKESFAISMDRLDGYRFQVDWGQPGVAPLIVDEPRPLGEGAGPNPTRLLAAAVGNCLGASLLFCLSKARVEVTGLHVRVEGEMTRNERGRMRVGGLAVTLEPRLANPEDAGLVRCKGLFEDFCIVTQSVRGGLDVSVDVQPIVAEPAAASA